MGTKVVDGKIVEVEKEVATPEQVAEIEKRRKEVVILDELLCLDQKLRRDVEQLAEAGGIELPSYLQEIKTRKDELRAQLAELG